MIHHPLSRFITRSILPVFLCLCFVQVNHAQIIYQTTHLSGPALYGNTTVTVTSNKTPSSGISCTGGPYHFPGGLTQVTEYTFSLSTATDHIKINMSHADPGVEYEMLINGQHYNLKSTEMSPLVSMCTICDPFFISNSSGNLTFTNVSATHYNCVTLNINQPNIQSLTFRRITSSDGDQFSFYFEEDSTTFINQPFIDTVHCPGASFNLNYTTNFTQRAGNVFTAQLSNAAGSFASPVTIGTRTATGSGAIPCTIPIGTPAGAGYRIRIVSSAPQDTSLDNQVNIRIKDVPANFSNGSNSPVCLGGILSLIGNTFTSGGVTWAWTGPNSFTANTRNATITNAAAIHAGDYILSATLNSSNCTLKDTTTVTITPLPNKPDANNNGPVCEGKALYL